MLIFWILAGSALLYGLQRWIYSGLWSRKLRMGLRFPAAAITEGEDAAVEERVENGKALPLPLLNYEYILCRNFAALTENDVTPLLFRRKLALPGRRAAVNRTAIRGLRRGLYTVTEGKLYCADLFYTARWTKPVYSQARLTVYPAKIPAERLSLPFRQLLGAVLTRRMAQEDPFLLKNIRPYEIYDSMRSINWKASARTGALKVNQFEYSTDEALILLLDLEGGSVEEREELIRLASSMSLLFLRRGVSVSLWSNGKSCISGRPLRVPAGSGVGHQLAVDEPLAQVKLGASVTEPFDAFLRGLPKSLTGSALPVVLSAADPAEIAALFQSCFGPGGGYLLTLGGQTELRVQDGVKVLSWNPVGEEGSL